MSSTSIIKYRGREYSSLEDLLAENSIGLSLEEINRELNRGVSLDIILGLEGKYWYYEGVLYESLSSIHTAYNSTIPLDKFEFSINNGKLISSLTKPCHDKFSKPIEVSGIHFRNIQDAYIYLDLRCHTATFRRAVSNNSIDKILVFKSYMYNGVLFNDLVTLYQHLDLICMYRTLSNVLSSGMSNILFVTSNNKLVDVSSISLVPSEFNSKTTKYFASFVSDNPEFRSKILRLRLTEGWSWDLLRDYFSTFEDSSNLVFSSIATLYEFLTKYYTMNISLDDFEYYFKGGSTVEELLDMYGSSTYRSGTILVFGNRVYRKGTDLSDRIKRFMAYDEPEVNILAGLHRRGLSWCLNKYGIDESDFGDTIVISERPSIVESFDKINSNLASIVERDYAFLDSKGLVFTEIAKDLSCNSGTVSRRFSEGWSLDLIRDYYSSDLVTCKDPYLTFSSLSLAYELICFYFNLSIKYDEFESEFNSGKTLEQLTLDYGENVILDRVNDIRTPVIIGNRIYKKLTTVVDLVYNQTPFLSGTVYLSLCKNPFLSSMLAPLVPDWVAEASITSPVRGITKTTSSPVTYTLTYQGNSYRDLLDLLSSINSNLDPIVVLDRMNNGETLEEALSRPVGVDLERENEDVATEVESLDNDSVTTEEPSVKVFDADCVQEEFSLDKEPTQEQVLGSTSRKTAPQNIDVKKTASLDKLLDVSKDACSSIKSSSKSELADVGNSQGTSQETITMALNTLESSLESALNAVKLLKCVIPKK